MLAQSGPSGAVNRMQIGCQVDRPHVSRHTKVYTLRGIHGLPARLLPQRVSHCKRVAVQWRKEREVSNRARRTRLEPRFGGRCKTDGGCRLKRADADSRREGRASSSGEGLLVSEYRSPSRKPTERVLTNAESASAGRASVELEKRRGKRRKRLQRNS